MRACHLANVCFVPKAAIYQLVPLIRSPCNSVIQFSLSTSTRDMNTYSLQTKTLVKEKLPKALLGGLIGTVVFTLMGQFMAPQIIGQPMDVAAMIAPLLGGSHMLGVVAHFINGIVVYPIAYLLFGISKMPGAAPLLH